MKKNDIAKSFLENNLTHFRCPTCHDKFVNLIDNGIVCPNNHNLDLSKKGSLHFINHKVSSEYDKDMLIARRNIINFGLFDGILNEIANKLDANPKNILDVGCGEGTPLKILLEKRENIDIGIGFDISKPGINLATDYNDANKFYCVADLTQLPFIDQSFDVVVDLFSPSSYLEFNRVIKKGGHLIKIIPNSNYLIELRHLLYGENSNHSSYDNHKVLDLYLKNYTNSRVSNVTYTLNLPENLRDDLILMTPMHWGKEANTKLSTDQLSKITVDVMVLDTKFV
ncbi:methyltransferase domain-containing protein [Apilactobacillus sp. TMW 2.2459]|uniref:methyltransferase domain-containing protein n=1 Tax=Apilactobacillus xinyiensis TaxID=2841032 RepID=UPI00200FC7AF|nr:methyltransferase domain-containing protein [Apilactobacillus xinyiensis]MCL0312428.1 methyltransferase domain-containing protein [Apilactobacillus xinyiensis]